MKITKSRLEQIIKEEIQNSARSEDTTAMNTVMGALHVVLPTIRETYDSLVDDESQAQFEKLLLENIKLYIQRWRAERGEMSL